MNELNKKSDEKYFRPPAVIPRQQNLNDDLYATVTDIRLLSKSTDNILNNELSYEVIRCKDVRESLYEDVINDSFQPTDHQVYAKINKQARRRSSTLPKNSSFKVDSLYSTIKKNVPTCFSSTESICNSIVASFEDSVFSSKVNSTKRSPRLSPVNFSESSLLKNSPLLSPKRRLFSSSSNFENYDCVAVSSSRSSDQVDSPKKCQNIFLNSKNVNKDNEAAQRHPLKVSIKDTPLKKISVKEKFVVRNSIKRNKLQKSRRRRQAVADDSSLSMLSQKVEIKKDCLNNNNFCVSKHVMVLSVEEDISLKNSLLRGLFELKYRFF